MGVMTVEDDIQWNCLLRSRHVEDIRSDETKIAAFFM
jgi:hypothetical protein